MLKVVFVACAILGTSFATIGSNLEEDDFKMIKVTHHDERVDEDALNDEEDSKMIQGNGLISRIFIRGSN